MRKRRSASLQQIPKRNSSNFFEIPQIFFLVCPLEENAKKHAVRSVKSIVLNFPCSFSSNFRQTFLVRSNGFVRGVRFLFRASSPQTVSIPQETTSEVCNYRCVLLSLMKLAVERLQPLCLCLHFLSDWLEHPRVFDDQSIRLFAVLLSDPVFALHAVVAREVMLGLLFFVQPFFQPSPKTASCLSTTILQSSRWRCALALQRCTHTCFEAELRWSVFGLFSEPGADGFAVPFTCVELVGVCLRLSGAAAVELGTLGCLPLPRSSSGAELVLA